MVTDPRVLSRTTPATRPTVPAGQALGTAHGSIQDHGEEDAQRMTQPPVTVRPAGRYGERDAGVRRVVGRVLVGVLGAAFLAWAVWAGLARATPSVQWQLLAFDTRSPNEVAAQFVVRTDADALVECDVAAQNRYHETVGLRTVDVPPGQAVRDVRATVPVREAAVAVVVEGCRLLDR
jgi:hypothetical protein